MSIFRSCIIICIFSLSLAMAADPPAPAWSFDFAVALEVATYQTINDGVNLYKANDPAGCYRLFQGSLRTLLPFLKEYPDYEKQVIASLTKAESLPTVANRALELRKPLDLLLEASRRRPEKRPPTPPPVVVVTPTPAPTAKPELAKPPIPETPKPVVTSAPKPVESPAPKPVEVPKPAMPIEPKPATEVASAKPVIPKPEVPKPEVPKPEVPKPEVPKPEIPKPEMAKPATPSPAPTPAPELDPKLSETEKMRIKYLASIAEPMDTTLWKRLGGAIKIKEFVHDFLFKASNDPRVNFSRNDKYPTDDASMLKIERSFIEFLSSRTGGPMEYKGSKMATAHALMAITDDEFDAMMSDLRDVLEVHEVAEPERLDLIALLKKFKPQIATHKVDEKPKEKSPE